jgi:hypothetical protein
MKRENVILEESRQKAVRLSMKIIYNQTSMDP